MASKVILSSSHRQNISPIMYPEKYWVNSDIVLGNKPVGLFSYFQKPIFEWAVGGLPIRLVKALNIKSAQDFKQFIHLISKKLDNSSYKGEYSVLYKGSKVIVSYVSEGEEGEVYKISIPGGGIQPIAWKRHYPFPFYKNMLVDGELLLKELISREHYLIPKKQILLHQELTNRGIYKDLPYFLCGYYHQTTNTYHSFVEFITDKHSIKNRAGQSRMTSGYIGEDPKTTNYLQGFLVDIGGLKYSWHN